MKKSTYFAVIVCLFPLMECQSVRPDSYSDWDACVIEQSILTRDSMGWAIEDGDTRVLYLSAQWGESPFRSEYQFGALLLQIPIDVAVGEPFTVGDDNTPGQYREGGMMLAYDSEQLVGTITEQSSSDEEVELLLDLRAESPTVDLNSWGSIDIDATVAAHVVASSAQCD